MDTRPRTVLLVVADPGLAGRLKALLRAEGCRVAALERWDELLDALGHLRLDLVVADVGMLPRDEAEAPLPPGSPPLILLGTGGRQATAEGRPAATLGLPLDEAALLAAIRSTLAVPD